jgi:hypothetical protein
VSDMAILRQRLQVPQLFKLPVGSIVWGATVGGWLSLAPTADGIYSTPLELT